MQQGLFGIMGRAASGTDLTNVEMMAVAPRANRHAIKKALVKVIATGKKREIGLDAFLESAEGMTVFRHRVAPRCDSSTKGGDRLQEFRPPLVVGKTRRRFVSCGLRVGVFRITSHARSMLWDVTIGRRGEVRSAGQSYHKFRVQAVATSRSKPAQMPVRPFAERRRDQRI